MNEKWGKEINTLNKKFIHIERELRERKRIRELQEQQARKTTEEFKTKIEIREFLKKDMWFSIFLSEQGGFTRWNKKRTWAIDSDIFKAFPVDIKNDWDLNDFISYESKNNPNIVKESAQVIKINPRMDTQSLSNQGKGIYLEAKIGNQIFSSVSIPRKFIQEYRSNSYIRYTVLFDARVPASERLKITQTLVNKVETATDHDLITWGIKRSSTFIEQIAQQQYDQIAESTINELYPTN